ncbi:YfhE family protein [Salirhabdus salicampi]|nr:YfhE family protein [Salirhabdus salicampi]MCP8617958.1 YfhE family protein [Salirhabdus salicampi]
MAKGKGKRLPHEQKNLNLSKTQQVLYQREFKQADRIYQQNKGL